MFTGIIQDIGVVESLIHHEKSLTLSISTKLNEIHLALGASVACNGCCLTITNTEKHPSKTFFYVDIGPESLILTRFSHVKIGDKINLEPALRMGDPLGGHQVSGHIDGSFEISSFQKIDENFWKLTLTFPNKFSKFILLKGSVAIAGISLTVANICTLPNETISVDFMIIPHTFNNTILQYIFANSSTIEVEFDSAIKTIASLFEGMIINYSQMLK